MVTTNTEPDPEINQTKERHANTQRPIKREIKFAKKKQKRNLIIALCQPSLPSLCCTLPLALALIRYVSWPRVTSPLALCRAGVVGWLTSHLAVLLLWLTRGCHRSSQIHSAVRVLRLLLCGFQNLERTQQGLIYTHHGAGIIELATIVGC